MVASFSWIEYNANATDTRVATNLNFGSTNTANLAPSLYPVTAGEQSYEKWLKAQWSTTAGAPITRINNLQFWLSAGTCTNSETIICNATTGTWAQLAYVAPVSGSVTSTLGAVAILIADPDACNVGINNTLATGTFGMTNTLSGESDFLVLQMKIGANASAGALSQKTFTLQYDEV